MILLSNRVVVHCHDVGGRWEWWWWRSCRIIRSGLVSEVVVVSPYCFFLFLLFVVVGVVVVALDFGCCNAWAAGGATLIIVFQLPYLIQWGTYKGDDVYWHRFAFPLSLPLSLSSY